MTTERTESTEIAPATPSRSDRNGLLGGVSNQGPSSNGSLYPVAWLATYLGVRRIPQRGSSIAVIGGVATLMFVVSVVLLSTTLSGLTTSPSTPRVSSTTSTSTLATWQGSVNGIHTWITVVPRGHTISDATRNSRPWWQWGNTSTDTYIFSIGLLTNVRVILSFDRQASGLPEARLYMNDLGRNQLAYAITGDQVQVRSNAGKPSLIIRPQGGGWLEDGKANYNLDLTIDGPTAGIDVGPVTNGEPTIELQVHGLRPGVPAWETRRIVADPYPDRSYTRFGATLRMADAPEFRVDPPLLPDFPYFGIGNGEINWFESYPNPLYFDGSSSKFTLEGFTGFQVGGLYEYNSLTLPPHVDFESPFAFYHFDPASRYAQLVVRAQSYPVGDQFGPDPTASQRSSFRYSWSSSDSTKWAYSIDVAGRHSFTEQVQVGDVRVWGVEPKDLPLWVSSKIWPVVTFVEAVGGYPGSEGIYFYSPQNSTPWPWLSGISSQPPDFLSEPYLPRSDLLAGNSSEAIPVNFRGEYSANNVHPTTLYLSPIDNRLHLLYARGGLWNLDSAHILRYHNLDDGPYIDGWTIERLPPQVTAPGDPPRALPGAIEESLYALHGFLVYSSPSQVKIMKAGYRPDTFQIAPPVDQASWLQFRQQLAKYTNQSRDPNDLASWFSAFAGTPEQIDGAQISGVRTTPDGFRFVLDLAPGFHATGQAPLDVTDLHAGKYVVSYNGGFVIEPLTNSALTMVVRLTPDQYVQVDEPVTIRVETTTTGLADLPGAILQVTARHNGREYEVANVQRDVVSGAPTRDTFTWKPNTNGRWDIDVHIETATGGVLAQNSHEVTAIGNASSSGLAVLSLSTANGQQRLGFALLIPFCALALLALRPILVPWIRFGSTSRPLTDDHAGTRETDEIKS